MVNSFGKMYVKESLLEAILLGRRKRKLVLSNLRDLEIYFLDVKVNIFNINRFFKEIFNEYQNVNFELKSIKELKKDAFYYLEVIGSVNKEKYVVECKIKQGSFLYPKGKHFLYRSYILRRTLWMYVETLEERIADWYIDVLSKKKIECVDQEKLSYLLKEDDIDWYDLVASIDSLCMLRKIKDKKKYLQICWQIVRDDLRKVDDFKEEEKFLENVTKLCVSWKGAK